MPPINGITHSNSFSEERAALSGVWPVLLGILFTADQGIYPVGLVLTRDANDVGQPLQEVAAEVLGAGDGATKDFTGALAAALPVEPGSVVVTDGVETFADDGSGRLAGDAGGTGTINYKTGAYSVSFGANVGNGTNVTADYITKVDAVLDREIDTAEEGSGIAVVMGPVARQALKVGAVAKAAPSAALLKALRNNRLYAL